MPAMHSPVKGGCLLRVNIPSVGEDGLKVHLENNIVFFEGFWRKGTLWANFLHARYCGALHPNQVTLGPSASHSWKILLAARGRVEEHLVWELSNGSCSFLWDNWAGWGPLAWKFPELATMAVVREFWVRGRWDSLSIEQLGCQEILEATRDTLLVTGEDPDSPFWDLLASGEFELSSIIPVIDGLPHKSWLYDALWRLGLPLKISFFMWRMLGHKLLVDTCLRRFRVAGLSKCVCCSSPDEESLHHLFGSSEIANSVWGFFEKPLGIFRPHSAVRGRFFAWGALRVPNPALRWLL
ncbi:uncharacterized protein [Coffea arabica]|uniref:Reverse transcriptase zinc-binding domain-containing protein n=1 Tax=Coffea arabica TaxID=13443 RepID=A0ABM4VPA3_COFAR